MDCCTAERTLFQHTHRSTKMWMMIAVIQQETLRHCPLCDVE